MPGRIPGIDDTVPAPHTDTGRSSETCREESSYGRYRFAKPRAIALWATTRPLFDQSAHTVTGRADSVHRGAGLGRLFPVLKHHDQPVAPRHRLWVRVSEQPRGV